MTLEKVVSGGQTGADRGGLEGALEMDFPHGGYCPRGRRAEDGEVPHRFQLVETEESNYEPRTKLNVYESDATVVFTHGAAEGGSKLTLKTAKLMGKPHMHVDLDGLSVREAAETVIAFCNHSKVKVLNVAGNRESVSPGIQDETRQIVMLVINQLRKEQQGGNAYIRDQRPGGTAIGGTGNPFGGE